MGKKGSLLAWAAIAVVALAIMAVPLSLLFLMDVRRAQVEFAAMQARYLAEAAVFRSIAEGGQSPGQRREACAVGQPPCPQEALGQYWYDRVLGSLGGGTVHTGHGETHAGPLNFGEKVTWTVRVTLDGSGRIVSWKENP